MSLITPNLADFSARIYTYDQISRHLWRKRCSGALYWVTRQPRNCPNRPVSTDTNSTSSSSSQRHGYLESWQGWYPGKCSLSTAFPDSRQDEYNHFRYVPDSFSQETRLKSSSSTSFENEANTWCRGLVRKSMSWDALCSSQWGGGASAPKGRDFVKFINPTRGIRTRSLLL